MVSTDRVDQIANGLRRIVAAQGYPFIQLACVIAAGILWHQDVGTGWVLGVALAPLGLSLVAGRRPVPRTPLDVPLVVFLLTAGIGVWAAYDRGAEQVVSAHSTPVGWQALVGLVLAGLVFYTFASMQTHAQQLGALGFLTVLGAFIALWFLSTHDWGTQPARWTALTQFGQRLQTMLPRPVGTELNANVAARIVVSTLPASGVLVARMFRSTPKGRWVWALLGIAAGAWMALALLLATSGGTILAVGGTLSLAAAWWLAARLSRTRRRLAFLGLLALGLVAGALVVALSPTLRSATAKHPVVANRLAIYAQAALLLRDYRFTGFGLGEFPLVHSTYALLIHVPVLPHAHALLLDVALGQGILGALAVVAALAGAAWVGLRALDRAEPASPALLAGMLSLTAATLHDTVDDPLYSSFGVLLLWVPAALVVAGLRGVRPPSVPAAPIKMGTWRTLGIGAALIVVLLAIFWRPLAAAWYANLGAVEQTRTELSMYNLAQWDNPTVDQIRQRAGLSAAKRLFARALALQAGQVTARTRLAQIALARGGYDQALTHAQAAWDAGHRDRVTRLIFGDALVAAGDVQAGVEIVRDVEGAEGRLDGQAWYRYWLGEDYDRAADAWRAVVLLNPDNERAAGAMQAAATRAEAE